MGQIVVISLNMWKKKEIKKQDEFYERLNDSEISKKEYEETNRLIVRVENLINSIDKEIEKEEKKNNEH